MNTHTLNKIIGELNEAVRATNSDQYFSVTFDGKFIYVSEGTKKTRYTSEKKMFELLEGRRAYFYPYFDFT